MTIKTEFSRPRVVPDPSDELAALWGPTPDVSRIFETSDTPKPKKSRSSALDDIFAAYSDTKAKERSPVKTSFDSLDKAMTALKRKLRDPPSWCIDEVQETRKTPEEVKVPEPEQVQRLLVGKRTPINQKIAPYPMQAKKV